MALNITDAKAYCRIDDETEDVVVAMLLDSAIDFVERWCGIGLTASEVTEYHHGGEIIEVSRRPIVSISEIYDRADEETIDSSDYQFFNGTIEYDVSGGAWGAGQNRWKVTYTGGYTSATVPNMLTNAVYSLVARAFDNRGGRTSESVAGWSVNWQSLIQGEIGMMLAPYRRVGL